MNPTTPPLPETLNWYDYVVAAAVFYGCYNGIRTGVVREFFRVLTWIFVIVVSVICYVPAGTWMKDYSGLDGDLSNLIAFWMISLVTWMFGVWLSDHGMHRWGKRKLYAIVENLGGLLMGAILLVLIMVWTSVAVTLMRSEFWHEQVFRNSCFGARVVQTFPSVAEMAQKKQPAEQLWFMKPIQRREEHTADGYKKRR